jgi:hypothetical protein
MGEVRKLGYITYETLLGKLLVWHPHYTLNSMVISKIWKIYEHIIKENWAIYTSF